MDIRALGCFILAGIALIGSITLYALGEAVGAAGISTLAGTLAGYAVGLYSEPKSGSE